MDRNLSILAAPMQPSLLRRCPYCRKLFVLRKVRVERHAIVGEVKVFRCTSCQREFPYAASHPAHAA
jgi:hypothetical protein